MTRRLPAVSILFIATLTIASSPTFSLGDRHGHIEITGEVPFLLGTANSEMNNSLDAALFIGTYGTYALGAGVHLLLPLQAPFYFSTGLEYRSAMEQDYLLRHATRYFRSLQTSAALGLLFPVGTIAQAYCGAGIGALTTVREAPLEAGNEWGVFGTAEAGLDFVFLNVLSAGPRISFNFGPLFGGPSGIVSFGYVTFAIAAGYSFQ